ncbi:hypothetical protein OVY01_16295 [Robbsia sp. Bb-Pol-6]|uniref:Secreted protein n=1 Tax=Robbsia betulipollinis TaxID=2981849 RepID=A0ABT3ZQB2_9BURK|nr:hypothetical protein [Robbsia betulipollinis]MCY0388736.1 hypothetical protein [Robbsia betulipollinis]
MRPIKLATTLGALLVSMTAIAQEPPDMPPPPRPEAAFPPPPPHTASAVPPPRPGAGSAAPPPPTSPAPNDASATTAGAIERYLINPAGDVDGLLLANDAIVVFAPPLGAQLTSTAAPGDRVSVVGRRFDNGTVRAERITIAKTGSTMADVPPGASPPREPQRGARLVELEASGSVTHVTSAPLGEPDGVLLSDGTIVKLTPSAAARFANLLRPGARVAAKGYGTRNRYGESLQATAFGTPGHVTPLYDAVPQ